MVVTFRDTCTYNHRPSWAEKLQTTNLICNFVSVIDIHIFLNIEICSLGSDWWEVIIGLGNGLAPNRRQAII